ncbi:MAG: hypothetical protein AAGI68_17035 [Planctomycetota bacterium]
MPPRHTPTRPLPALLALLFPLTLAACANIPGQVNYVTVPPRYTDLAGKSVAVMVAADPTIDQRHPKARENIMGAVSRSIVSQVEGARVVNPRDLVQYQDDNPTWTTVTPSILISALNVDRLILIDLAEYRTTEPGDRTTKRGVINGAVSVYEAEAADPDEMAVSVPVAVQYPRLAQTKIGRFNASDSSIELATVKEFTLRAGGVFFEHQIEVD